MDYSTMQVIVTALCAVLASSGFWAFLQHKSNKNDNFAKMLVGLGHDRIVYLGNQYIRRGYITHDEYENLATYLYEPYNALGGNGSAKKIMHEIEKLPMRPADE